MSSWGSERRSTMSKKRPASSLTRLLCLCGAVATSTACVSAFLQLQKGVTAPQQQKLQLGRREQLSAVAASAALLFQKSASAELNPLLEKDLKRDAPTIQAGLDWLNFELGDAIKNKNLPAARKTLGDAQQGAYVSPLETRIIIPITQLCSANLDAEEDGWYPAVKKMQEAIEDMRDQVGMSEWPQAQAAYDKLISLANFIMGDINKRGEAGPYFVLVDDNYGERRKAYLQQKKDDIAYRNMAGNLVMR
eukprot:TRINITY_DN18669_c5_g1_i1.p1 TRINITY_DN18669_c5_g1~~TRINITY_DN18669_c5_g1_i1.p1  ORF type:complete len:249 (-),score=66.71 TRINITY_DN18669_c5_g1_i1:176-922(-)